MKDILSRLETSEAGSRELDEAIARDLGWVETPLVYGSCFKRPDGTRATWLDIPHYTTGIDAAMTLIDDAWHYEIHRAGHYEKWIYDVTVNAEYEGIADTPALAICIAALHARRGNGE